MNPAFDIEASNAMRLISNSPPPFRANDLSEELEIIGSDMDLGSINDSLADMNLQDSKIFYGEPKGPLAIGGARSRIPNPYSDASGKMIGHRFRNTL